MTSHVPGTARPLPPAWRFGVTSASSSPSRQPHAERWVLLCSRPCAPGPTGTVPAHLPPSCPVSPPSAAGRWVPGLPALPGEAGTGRGAQMAAGRGTAERADCRARAASGTLFLAARRPGVLSFTHLFTPGPRGR